MFVIPDKSRSLYPVNVTFTSGEIPTAEKLSAISTQARRGLNIVEYILGDTWNQGGDAFLSAIGATTYALMIPNIARYLGKTNNLNPRVPYTTSVTSYNHLVSISDAGNRELTLSLPPTALTSFTWAGTSAPSGAPQTSIGNVDSAGTWFVDRDTGWCYFYDVIQSDWNVTYIPQVEGDLGEEATWNVIPDINRDTAYDFGGCKIAYKNGTDNSEGYIIYLPPRGPLDSDREIDRSPHSHSDNFSSTPDSLPVKFWQSKSVEATTGTYAEHYRYSLPKIITDNYSNGAVLPQGLIYLWDHSQTGTIIEGLTFTAEDASSPRSYVLVASGTALDSWVTNYFDTAYPSADLTWSGDSDTAAYHTSSYYPSAGLKVITIGSDITATLSNLIKMFYNHDHGSANSLPGNIVSHRKLGETFSPIVSQASPSLRLPVSTWGYDDHPQYIHRFGYNPDLYSSRDIYKGGMLGDLLFCSSGSTSNYQNLTSDSRKIRFGTVGEGTVEPSIFYCLKDDNEDPMDSIHINYKKITIGDDNGSSLDFRSKSSDIATSARVHHTSGSEPIVSIERADKTAGEGEGAALKVNRIYTGGMSSGEYGYSGADASAGWGAVRSYVISPSDWTVFVCSNTGSYVSTQRQALTEFLMFSGGEPTLPILRLFQTGTAQQVVAFHHFKLPASTCAIVNVGVALRAFTNSLNSIFLSMDIIRQEHGWAVGGSLYGSLFTGASGTETLWSIDPISELYGTFPASLAVADDWISGLVRTPTEDANDIKAIIYSDYDQEISSYYYNNSYVFRIKIDGVGAAASVLYVAPIRVYYRIKEF